MSKYNDTPLYLINGGHMEDVHVETGYQKSSASRTYKNLSTHRFAKTADQPSQLHIWYMQEDKKRKEGLENEIDLNEIKAALRGVKNKWFRAVSMHSAEFSEVFSKKYNWHRFVELKNEVAL